MKAKHGDAHLRHYETNLFGESRTSYEWAYQKTIEDLQGCDPNKHWVAAYSGGKDSTAVVTLSFTPLKPVISHSRSL